MLKKIIIMALIPSLLIYLTGCYSMYNISKDDLKTTSENTTLRVTTINDDSYLFHDNSYFIRHDTLFGKISYNNQPAMPKTLPLKDISTLQIEKINGGITLLAVIGVTIALFAIVGLIQGSIFWKTSLER